MNRLHYIFGALMLLTSCTMDQVTELNPGREIEFRVLTTKGGVVNTSNFTEFKLYAFDGDGVYVYDDTYKFEAGRFVSQEKHYWPTDGSDLYFQAYHQYGPQTYGDEERTDGNLVLQGFSAAKDISSQVDLVSATASANKNVIGSVELNFQHSLSQIEVRAKNPNQNYVCEVYGLRIANVYSDADFDVANGDWKYSAKTIYEVLFDQPRLLGENPESMMPKEDDNAFLIPQELIGWTPETDPTNESGGAFFALKVSIKTADTGSKVYPVVEKEGGDWIALPIEGEWQAGWKYIYTWDIPEVCGYVDPYKAAEDILDITLFPPGAPVRGEQIKIFYPAVAYWSFNYMYN